MIDHTKIGIVINSKNGDTEGYMDYLEEKSQISFYEDNLIYYSTISELPFFDDYSASSNEDFELYSEKRVRLANNNVVGT